MFLWQNQHICFEINPSDFWTWKVQVLSEEWIFSTVDDSDTCSKHVQIFSKFEAKSHFIAIQTFCPESNLQVTIWKSKWNEIFMMMCCLGEILLLIQFKADPTPVPVRELMAQFKLPFLINYFKLPKVQSPEEIMQPDNISAVMEQNLIQIEVKKRCLPLKTSRRRTLRKLQCQSSEHVRRRM